MPAGSRLEPGAETEIKRLVLNVVVERLTLLLRIREVPGSNLGLGNRLCLSRFFVVFLSPSRRILEWRLKLGHHRFLPNPFPFIAILSTLCSLVTETAS
jgi:hypothetical protein